MKDLILLRVMFTTMKSLKEIYVAMKLKQIFLRLYLDNGYLTFNAQAEEKRVADDSVDIHIRS
ncbi:MAG: hypothetical protein MZV64_42030 [Ignavibacteriales bacterium]|nr:hypothetical protein [Ignavibacteriales bacterium]